MIPFLAAQAVLNVKKKAVGLRAVVLASFIHIRGVIGPDKHPTCLTSGLELQEAMF